MVRSILSIAGSDSCGGSGLQADLRSATLLKTHCSTVATCFTAQNSQKFYDIFYSTGIFVSKQIQAVLEDIKIGAIKIGMLGNVDIISDVSEILQIKANNIPIICDPVMISSSGGRLLEKDAIEILKSKIISNSYLVTPNIFEAEILSGTKIRNVSDVKIAAIKILEIGAKNVLIKGAHLNSRNIITHYLIKSDEIDKIFSNKRLDFDRVAGTGCILSSAIACFLSRGLSLELAISRANQFAYKAIKNSCQIGQGRRFC